MENDGATPQPELAALPERRSDARVQPVLGIGILIVILAAIFLIFDFGDVIFARGNRNDALALITPNTRITQVERSLNAAGYLTLYMEGPPAALQISSLRRYPLTAQLLHKILPKSYPDRWLRTTMANATRFYVTADSHDHVKLGPDGKPEVYFAAPEQVEIRSF